MRGVHDLGGLPAGEVDRAEHDPSFFEKRVDALMRLVSRPEQRVIVVDELRRTVESLPKEAYDELGYYERWIYAIASLMVEKGVLTQQEIGMRMHELEHRLGIADHEH
jgi:Nitrile hydratase beta subunit